MTEHRIVADDTYPHLYRIHWPDGVISGLANITRCRDAVRQAGATPVLRPHDPSRRQSPAPRRPELPTGLPSITLTIHSDDAGFTWEAWVDDDPLGRFKEPLTQAARVLLKDGVDPKTKLKLKHRGADHISLSSTVGRAAKLAVIEYDDPKGRREPRFVKYRPYPGRQDAVSTPTVAPPERENGPDGTK